jgi:hypothetical protein
MINNKKIVTYQKSKKFAIFCNTFKNIIYYKWMIFVNNFKYLHKNILFTINNVIYYNNK